MPATITLQAENQTESAFDDAIAELDRLEREAGHAGVALSDVNKELESRAASEYAQAVKKAADELDGTAERARRAAEETERLANKKERMERLSAGVTAVSSAFTALKDGGEIAVATFDKVYDAISRLAERGNEGMMELKSSIDSFNFSTDNMLESLLTADGQLTATGERINTRLQEISRGWDVYFKVILDVTREQRMATEARLNGEQALADYKAKVAAEDDARFFAELNNLDDVNRRIAENVRLLELQSEGKYTGTPERLKEIQSDLNMLTARRNELLREQEGTVEEVAAAEQKALEEAAKAEEERHQKAVAAADERIEQAEKLQSLLVDGLNELMREEEERQQKVEEWHLKNEGREEELHAKRIQWIEEETATAVEMAETEEERIKATLEGERRLRNELHSEKMRLIELEERRQKEAAEAAKKAEADRLAELQGRAGKGDDFNRDAAVRQVLAARQMEAREKFFDEGRDEGLSQKELQRALALEERAVFRRTQNDVRFNRLSMDELASSQQKLAESSGELAQAEFRRSVTQAQLTEAVANNNQMLRERVDQLTGQMRGLLNMINAEGKRAGAVRRGLG